MKKTERKLNNESENNKKEDEIINENNNTEQDNIILKNELLSSLFKNPPNFEKKYENEELNKFKDEILIYLSERNKHYMSIIKHFQEKIQENKKEYLNQINSITQNYNSILSSQALLNNKIDKISNFDLFINKTNDQLITHEIRINNLSSDFIKSTQKYDKIYLDNLELPGYIGKFAKFKNCQAFFENIIREIDKTNLYKEKNNLDIKAYKEKINGIIKSVHLLVKNNNDAQMKYIRQLNDKSLKECKEMNDLLSNRVCDLRIENAKYSMELVKKSEEMNKEWKKILEIKDNLINLVNEKITNFRNVLNSNMNSINSFRKEFEEFQMRMNEIEIYYKEKKSDTSNNNTNLNNNSCNNVAGCFISSALPLDKKNWKNFPRKFSKRSKTKNKYLEKKQFLKSISSLNSNNRNTENYNIKQSILDNEIKSNNIIKLDDNDIKLNKEKDSKKRNVSNSLNKEKSINSIEKNKYNIENQSKKNVYGFKEPRSSKTLAKIEINSHDMMHNLERNKKEENRLFIQNKSNEEKNTNKIFNINENLKIKNNEINKNNNNLFSSSKKHDNEKEGIVLHKYNKKNKKSVLLSSKSNQSDDLDNNSMSNINFGNSNTLNTTNDNNYSMYTTNSICNVNRFVLNDGMVDTNDRVIKELASELEQSTNKKDRFASNKKKIEQNFNIICNKILPLNFNKINEQIDKDISQNEDINNNLNIEENIKINTVSTEKTEDRKTGNNNNNNICNINIHQNDYNLLNKKMDSFDKKLIDLESLLKEKIVEILLQVDNLQSLCYYSLNKKTHINQKYNNINNSMNNNTNLNINEKIDYQNNLKIHNSHDDYFIHSHSVKKFAPIIEIDPIKLQFSPSPIKTLNQILSNKKNKEQNKNKGIRIGFTNNFKDIKLIKKNDNKENVNTTNNIDNYNLTKFRLLSKNGIGVNKWINLNKLINYEQSKVANISSNNMEFLAKFENN